MLSRDTIADHDAKTRAVEEALHSRTLARSEQLAQFLRYICTLELEGRGAEITEYSIATNALHRPTNYSPGEDSSVRSRAHALRRKLQEYYESEAPLTELRIELPKGSYRPVFVTALEPVVPPAPLPAAIVRRTSKLLWIAVGAIALGALAAVLLVRPDPIDPLVRAAWGPVLRRGSDVLVLLSAPPLLRTIPSQPGAKPESNVLEPAPEWASRWYTDLNLNNLGGKVFLAPSRGYSVFSDSFAAMTVSSLLALAGATYHAMPEYAVEPRGIHENGLVVIGAPAYTRFLARILQTTPYSIWWDPVANDEVLGMKHGGSGHPYIAKRDPQLHRYTTVYGLITVLPSQPGQSRPERMLIFAGFRGSPGAQAAIDYFRSPTALRDLERRLRQQGYATFPPAYQVVVRCGVDSETAINAVYEAHIVIPNTPLIE
uniref:Uncharacterized protein n=1 Tax=Solibacter usitatus (strain Ellin6076) TaxID=234267 RepID=Q022J4_SOLUE